MVRPTFARSISCVLAALALAACGDGPTEPEDDEYLLGMQPGNGRGEASASGFDPEIIAALAAGIDAFNAGAGGGGQ